jgi:transcriptional regulator with XRE-family HTH domain
VQSGLTQDQVAEALNIRPEAASRMESGIVIPSLARLVEFAGLFKRPVEKFFNKATRLIDDNAAAIAQHLNNLNRADRQLVLELVEKPAST